VAPRDSLLGWDLPREDSPWGEPVELLPSPIPALSLGPHRPWADLRWSPELPWVDQRPFPAEFLLVSRESAAEE